MYPLNSWVLAIIFCFAPGNMLHELFLVFEEASRALHRALPEAAVQALGNAISATQLERTVLFAVLWSLAFLALGPLLAAFTGAYAELRPHVQRELRVSIIALLHALVASLLGGSIVAFPDEQMDRDMYYGASERSTWMLSISCGYFMWDVFICLSAKKLDLGFLFHGVTCFTCYLVAQAPFLNYHAAWFLLFELSTPFMQVRQILLMTGQKKSEAFGLVQTMFGVSFVVVRLVLGLPQSALVHSMLLPALLEWEEGQGVVVHSAFAWWYVLVCNVGLNLLNIFWASLMLKKFAKKRKQA